MDWTEDDTVKTTMNGIPSLCHYYLFAFVCFQILMSMIILFNYHRWPAIMVIPFWQPTIV